MRRKYGRRRITRSRGNFRGRRRLVRRGRRRTRRSGMRSPRPGRIGYRM